MGFDVEKIKQEAVDEFVGLFMADIKKRTYEMNNGEQYVYLPAIEGAIDNVKRTLIAKSIFDKK